MSKDLVAELASVQRLVEGAVTAGAPRQAVLWSFRQFPALYEGLRDTCESRFADDIARLARVVLRALADSAPDSPKAPAAAEAVVARLRAMHVRLGIPALDLQPPAPPKGPKRKAK